MQRTRRLICCSTVVVALLALACNSESNAPPPAMPPAIEMRAVDPGEAESEPAADLGDVDPAPASTRATELAADVPLYEPAQLISSMTSPERGTIVNLRSDAAPEQVSAWYGTEFPARGWELEKQSGAAGTYLVTARKGGRRATALITRGASATQILITVLAER